MAAEVREKRRWPAVLIALAVATVVLASVIVPCALSLAEIGTRLANIQNTKISFRRIEDAIEVVCTDGNIDQFRDIFDATALDAAAKRLQSSAGLDAFEAVVEIYTQSTFAVIRQGRNAASESNPYRDVLRPEVVAKLATMYVNEQALVDLWGNPLRIFVGPWPEEWGPVLFRTMEGGIPPPYQEGEIPEPDALLLDPLPDRGGRPYSWPADPEQQIYIWSVGANGISNQPRYDPTHTYAPPASRHYPEVRNSGRWGLLGDDVNNWDQYRYQH